MRLRDIGEFGLIDLIRKRFPPQGKEVLIGIGDDTAVIKGERDNYLLLTCDTLVEGVHFDLSYTPFRELGWKAMAANLSDIASMGGLPHYALVSLCLPPSTDLTGVKEFYQGMRELGQRFKVEIVGGDTVSSPVLIISITLTGEVEKDRLVTRSGARSGDSLLVTGVLGGSEGGLELLKEKGPLPKGMGEIIRRHLAPMPRLKEARLLVENLKPNAMIDISDGLALDLSHLARESRVGAEIWKEKIPIHPQAEEAARILRKSPYDLALYGGEDYELLLALSSDQAQEGKEILRRAGLTIIGQILPPDQGLVISEGGRRSPLVARGYDHFSK
jgi:thiamine-monophosphate kinase